MSIIFRSKAPLRIGLAGGGTDVSPYSDLYGGAILNAAISLYAHASLELTPEEDTITIYAADRNEMYQYPIKDELPIDGQLDLAKGVYNRIVKDYNLKPQSFKLTSFVDAPAGSGLGTSSTLVVALLGVFVEWLKLPLGDYDIAHYAYVIERLDLKLAGGKQDHYAATFGGFNFMEFYGDDKVIVNPLRLKSGVINELENNLLLFYTDSNRESAKIIEIQSKNVVDKNQKSIAAMHQLKEQAQMMKEALLVGDLLKIGEILDFGFEQKKLMAQGISNSHLENIYSIAKENGAAGGKISGAGGGGFMIFYCPLNTKYKVLKALKLLSGRANNYQFVNKGLATWTVTQ